MPNREPGPLLIVVAAVVVRQGRVLLTRRPEGAHLASLWEFPGGKLEPGETPAEALTRELAEEIGVSSRVGAPFAFSFHAYEDRRVLLLTYLVDIEGEPVALECAALGWFSGQEVAGMQLPPADGPILERLLPLLAGRDASR